MNDHRISTALSVLLGFDLHMPNGDEMQPPQSKPAWPKREEKKPEEEKAEAKMEVDEEPPEKTEVRRSTNTKFLVKFGN